MDFFNKVIVSEVLGNNILDSLSDDEYEKYKEIKYSYEEQIIKARALIAMIPNFYDQKIKYQEKFIIELVDNLSIEKINKKNL